MKKVISFLIAVMLLTATAGTVDLYVDMEKITTDTPPTIVEGRTLVPLRAIFEAIGATVEWDQNTYTATGVKGDTTVVVQLNNTTAYVNGEARTLDVPAQLINNRTMVPARFISESMGCDVTWYQATQTAAVANETKGQHIYVTATGDKYHYSGTCNGGTYYEATLAEAMGRGLTPCDKCVLTDDSSVPTWLNPEGTSQPISQPDPQPSQPTPQPEPQPSPQPSPQPQPSTPAVQPQTPPPAPAEPAPGATTSRKVYVTKTGKRYHYSDSCNGGTYYESTLDAAKRRGLTPCNKCVN